MKIIVDRIEGCNVVVELQDGQTISVPLALLPDATEGRVYVIENDATETDARYNQIEGKMNKLFTE